MNKYRREGPISGTKVIEVRTPNQPASKIEYTFLIEYEDKYNAILDQMTLIIHYRDITVTQSKYSSDGKFEALYCPFSNRVKLTSSSFGGGFLVLDPHKIRGFRIGTYLMNIIVNWAKQWPDAEVATISLLTHQATNDNTVRRNTFYEKFGIQFSYDETNKESGKSLAMRVSELELNESWKSNITELPVREYISRIIESNKEIHRDANHQKRILKEAQDAFKAAEASPFRWMLGQLIENYRIIWKPLLYISIVILILILKRIP